MEGLSKCLVLLFAGLILPLCSYEAYVDQIEKDFCKEVKEELGLMQISSGGRMPQVVEQISLGFQMKERATLSEARALLIYLSDKFADKVSSHEAIRPHLAEYPFPPSRAAITLYFSPDKIGSRVDGSVATAGRLKDVFYYSSTKPSGYEVYWELEESEAEALKACAPLSLPFVHEMTEKEKAIDHLFSLLSPPVVGFQADAIGGDFREGINAIEATYIVYEHTTPKKAKAHLRKVAEKILHKINECEELRPYFVKSPLTFDQLNLTLKFWNKRGYRYYDGTPERVTLEKGKVILYKSNAMAESIEVSTESY